MAVADSVAVERSRRGLPKRKCGAKPAKGRTRPCGQPAGHGTSHPGYGSCRKHGGMTPNGIKAAAKEQAADFARGMLGAEVDVDLVEAPLQAVRLALGQVTYYRLAMQGEGGEELRRDYERMIEAYARTAKMAVDCGVADRLVKIEERLAEQIVLAAEAGLATLSLTSAERMTFTMTFTKQLEKASMVFDADATAEEVAA